MANIENTSALWKVVIGLLFISTTMGFVLPIAVNVFLGELRGLLSTNPVVVEGVVETIRLYNDERYTDDRKRLISVHYSISLEITYEVEKKKYLYVESFNTDENGKFFSSIETVVKLAQKLSPSQPITLWRGAAFSTSDKNYLLEQNLISGIKGKRALNVSKSSPDIVIKKASRAKGTILSAIMGFVTCLALLGILSFFSLRNADQIRFMVKMFAISIGLVAGISISTKLFWNGGRNTKIYDPNKPEDPESLTIYKDLAPSELGPR